jgi:hypothetical protein
MRVTSISSYNQHLAPSFVLSNNELQQNRIRDFFGQVEHALFIDDLPNVATRKHVSSKDGKKIVQKNHH